jgi:hypothetical protein
MRRFAHPRAARSLPTVPTAALLAFLRREGVMEEKPVVTLFKGGPDAPWMYRIRSNLGFKLSLLPLSQTLSRAEATDALRKKLPDHRIDHEGGAAKPRRARKTPPKRPAR